MDVDKLRPGTVPLAPDTVLWFEFLLDPTLLEKHLNKPNPDPTAWELMIKFLSVDKKEEIVIKEDENGEAEPVPKITKRTLAIKLLTLKVMAFLNWDLDLLESKLPLPMQMALLRDLLFIAMEEEPNIPNHSALDFTSCDHQTIFSVSLYHRWVLKAFMCGALITKQARVPFIPMPGVQDPNLIAANQREMIRSQLDSQVMISLEILNKILFEAATLTVPTLDSFVHLNEESADSKTKWENGVTISSEEFKCQFHYELGSFCFFREDYPTAKQHFSECLKYYQALEKNPVLKSKVKFCSIDTEKFKGYCLANDIAFVSSKPSTDVYERFKASVKEGIQNLDKGILQILQADNLCHQIPLMERDMLEIDIQVASCSGFTVTKDLLLGIPILNFLRRTATNEVVNVNFVQTLQNGGEKGLNFFKSYLKAMFAGLQQKEAENLKYSLFDLMLRDLTWSKGPEMSLASVLLQDPSIKSIFKKEEILEIELKMGTAQNDLDEMLNSSASVDVPLELISRSPRLEVMNIQQQLMQTYDVKNVKKLLQKLCSKDPAKSWFKLNSKWDLPIPLQSVVMSLPKGFVQDLVYILLAKSRELSNNKDFLKSILLLENTVKEAKESPGISSNTLYKLNRLIDWEILLVQINQYLEKYPEKSIDPEHLISSCKSCLAASQSGDSVIPRLEVKENCALALLNLKEWETLTSMDKRWIYLELAAAIAYACQDIHNYKGSKKISRNAWDLILPVFGPNPQSKRGGVGGGGATASPTSSNLTKNILVNFLTRLREPTCLTVVISLLAGLHNVLKDDHHFEINCEYVGLWPAVVSNSNSYSSRSVAEVLTQVALQGLKFTPTHEQYPFLKVLGDINYVNNDWASALRYYLEAGAVASDYFTQPVPKAALDDTVYKRMIKCCSQLQCHTQAAVLCQFLENVDYTMAFKCLSETKNSHCVDSMDAYYPCIWDLTILEYLINLHNKRGETQRKQQVIKIIGLLELNSNNNEEIQREAANIRRGQFLRALTNQYSILSNLNSFFVRK